MTRAGVAAGCLSLALVAGTWWAWSDTTTTVTTTAGAEHDAPEGSQLFLAKGCAACHTGPDSTSPFRSGPSLAEARQWAATRKPGVCATDYLAESMLVPAAFVSPAHQDTGDPLTGMPDLGLSPQEVAALITYLLHA